MRTALAFSTLLEEPLEVYNIRANRPRPGLARQHLTGVKAFQKIFSSRVEGATPGSTRIKFYPGGIGEERSHTIDIGTAGSITLLLQSLAPVLCFHNIELRVTGGTDVRWSPPIDYFRKVFLYHLEAMGVNAGVELIARGYYPRGNGRVRIVFSPPSGLKGVAIEERGSLSGIEGIAHSSNLPRHVVEREARAAKHSLSPLQAEIGLETGNEISTGTGIALWAEYQNTVLGTSSLGERGKSAEKVGKEAASTLFEEINSPATLDIHMADQIVPYAALARGRTSFIVRELTGHLKTNMELTQEMLGVSFREERLDEGYRVSVEGRGW